MAVDPPSTSANQGPGFTVTIFGFPSSQQRAVANQFTSMGDGATADFPGSEECNWVNVTYMNEWEAVRALRKNGEVLSGTIMIGVKWANGDQTDPAAQRVALNTSMASEFGQISSPVSARPTSSATITGASGASASYNSGRAVKLKPSSSAFHVDQAPAAGGGTPGGKGGDWGLSEQAKRLQKGDAQPESVLGRVGSAIFGW
ncbi:hypothetical protein FRC03_010579 [Tulasnella sp. 419]|nr:hypothetical protein FRC02_010982 [Tulasnella sp. 418]KAG8957061.1 hypothetical protein FRC03_010579 [Tulasnella sp. 419]